MKFTEFINTSHFDEYVDEDITTLYGKDAFWYSRPIDTLTLPNLTSISNNTMALNVKVLNAPNLKDVKLSTWTELTTLNAPIEIIQPNGFYNCRNLKNVDFTNVIDVGGYIGQSVPITSIYMPNLVSLPYSKSGNFNEFRFLKTIDLPNFTSMANYSMFLSCYNLTTVNMPKLSNLQQRAFQHCKRIKSITLAGNPTYIPSCCFQNCYNIPSIPLNTDDVEIVYSGAFRSCYNLTSVSFPKLSAISGSYCFAQNYNLLSVYLMGSSVAKLNQTNNFENTPISGYWSASYYYGPESQYGSIYVPMSLVDEYKATTNWIYYSNRIVGI